MFIYRWNKIKFLIIRHFQSHLFRLLFYFKVYLLLYSFAVEYTQGNFNIINVYFATVFPCYSISVNLSYLLLIISVFLFYCLQVDTPDSVLQSGLGLGPDMGHTILRSMVDPRDYDRLRYLQMNGGQANSFEETIQRVN